MPLYDVAVIGAGPAGSAASKLLAGWGHRVLLVHRDGGSAQLGESLPPSCRKVLAAVGLLDAVDAAGFVRSTGNTVWWGGEERQEVFGAGALGYQIDRAAFDRLLREQAARSGAELRRDIVRDVRLGSGARLVLDEGEEIAARFVLDCSGRAGTIARAGWREMLPGQPRTVALVAVWTSARWPGVDPTHTLVESYGDGWAWSVPVSPESRYVTAMVDPRRTALARDLPALEIYRAELAKTRHLSALLEGAAIERGPWGCDASSYRARSYASAPVLLVGDAASFVDPLSSFGVKKALASAWLAAIAVHTALRSATMTSTALDFFGAREADMAAAFVEQARAFFDTAASTHQGAFWTDRAAAADLPPQHDPDVRVLRDDPRVRSAFEDLKARPRLAVRPGRALRIEARPVVRGHEIVLEDRLFSPDVPAGLRFLRDVDLAGILAEAPRHSDVPELFGAYNRRFPPVGLPDFLGALSVLLAFGLLEHEPAGA